MKSAKLYNKMIKCHDYSTIQQAGALQINNPPGWKIWYLYQTLGMTQTQPKEINHFTYISVKSNSTLIKAMQSSQALTITKAPPVHIICNVKSKGWEQSGACINNHYNTNRATLLIEQVHLRENQCVCIWHWARRSMVVPAPTCRLQLQVSMTSTRLPHKSHQFPGNAHKRRIELSAAVSSMECR